jgi:hypothetical protein
MCCRWAYLNSKGDQKHSSSECTTKPAMELRFCESAGKTTIGFAVVSFGGWMTNAPSKNAQHPASAIAQKREWKKPVLDILALADAEGGHSHVHDGVNRHKSA